MGFSSAKADTPVAELSGGEKARLLMGLATLGAPNLLILDEPDEPPRHRQPRGASGGHQRIRRRGHPGLARPPTARSLRRSPMACGERLRQTVRRRHGRLPALCARTRPRGGDAARDSDDQRASQAEVRRQAARARQDSAPLRKKLTELEARLQKLGDLLTRVDAALAQPDAFAKDSARALQLATQRKDLENAIAASEEEWLLLADEIEGISARA